MIAVKTFRHCNATHEDWMLYRRRCEEARKMAAMFNKYLESNQYNTKVHELVLTRLGMFICYITR